MFDIADVNQVSSGSSAVAIGAGAGGGFVFLVILILLMRKYRQKKQSFKSQVPLLTSAGKI